MKINSSSLLLLYYLILFSNGDKRWFKKKNEVNVIWLKIILVNVSKWNKKHHGTAERYCVITCLSTLFGGGKKEQLSRSDSQICQSKQKCCAISLPSHLHLILGDAEAFPSQSQISHVFCVFQTWPKHTWELSLRILSNLMPEPPQLVIFVAKKLSIYSMSVSWITELFTP